MTDEVAVITGASRGLGRSTAFHLAKRGVCVIGTYHSHAVEAEAVVTEVTAAGGHAAMLPLDVGQSADFPAFAARVSALLASTFNRHDFDYLVNNAGIGAYAPFANTTEAQFDELVRVQLKAPLFLTQALLPIIADGGRILNVSSGAAHYVVPGFAAYAAMKGGVEVLTRYMAKELGERRIRVNVVALGAIETDFGGGAVRDNAHVKAAVAGMIALGRAGLPDDVGKAVAAILSDGLGWVNGACVDISGGQNL